MDIKELKEYIISENKTVFILESIGCYDIKQRNKEIRFACDKHTNPTSNVIYTDSLSVKMYSNDSFQGDIVTLVSYLLEFENVGKSMSKLYELLNIKPTKKHVVVNDPSNIFTNARYKHYNTKQEDIQEIDMNSIGDIVEMPYYDWVKEGITPSTQIEFGVGYHPKTNRVIFAHRHYSNGSIVGIIGRTLYKDYEELGIAKYLPIKAYPKSHNLFGLYENYEGIQRAGYVVVFESEKSVMKRHSRKDKTGVAVCCHEISSIQVGILISLNVEIIIAFDEGIPEEFIKIQCDKFYPIRNVSYIKNIGNIMKSKESPGDLHDKAYKVLLNRRVKYNGK